MKFLSRWGARLAGFAKQSLTAFASRVGRFFSARPALKRGLFAFMLQQLVLLPFAFVDAHTNLGVIQIGVALFGLMWSAFLFGLFWGMGAERASLDWGRVFALPTATAFRFWRWHAIERKRFFAVIVALNVGLLLAAQLGGL